MKRSIYYTLLLCVLLSACATVKTAKIPGPEGEWDYAITGTPNGDYSGVMAITNANNALAGVLRTSDGDAPLNNLVYKAEEKKLEGEFDYNGMTVVLSGIVEGDAFKGTVSTGGYEFPMTAARKK
ncbi:MAG: hypothetical protein HC859_04540 [Bacteroidia bacterium]|nr:hypothetical protein [Bacteroidia bacterium]